MNPLELNGTPLENLAQAGLELPSVAAPVASYVPAVQTGNLVYTAGQLPFIDGALKETGVVSDQPDAEISPEVAANAARIACLNALAAIDDLVGLNNVVRVVKVTGFVASETGFTGQPGVINGASELLGRVFGEAGQHARSAVGVNQLPLNSPVEVELIVEVAG